jgi:hypothetical protein
MWRRLCLERIQGIFSHVGLCGTHSPMDNSTGSHGGLDKSNYYSQSICRWKGSGSRESSSANSRFTHLRPGSWSFFFLPFSILVAVTFELTAFSDVCPRLREEADISLLIDLYRNSRFTICSHGNWGVSLLHTRMQMSSRHLTKEFRVSKGSIVCGLCIRDLHCI